MVSPEPSLVSPEPRNPIFADDDPKKVDSCLSFIADLETIFVN